MARWTRSTLLPVIVLFAIALVGAPAALADGDPASDVLPYARAFYPYAPNTVPAAARKALDSTLAGAAAAGYPIRVAIVTGRGDLGAAGSLDGKPAQYAAFLSYEDAGIVQDPILIVMPAGFGLALKGRNAPVTGLGSLLTQIRGRDPDSLAALAEMAVRKLASDAGHPIEGKGASGGGGKKGGGSSTGLILGFGGLVAVVVLAATWSRELRRRRASASASGSESGSESGGSPGPANGDMEG